MRILYVDCFAGISGDMTLGALIDAGADLNYVESELNKIDIEPFTLRWETVNKQGITALKAHVDTTPSHHHRTYTDIVSLIKQAGFHDKVTEISLAIFKKIGEAESKIHQQPLEKVHFHEVGAVDSIVDTVGVALALHSLAIDRIDSAPVPLGSGEVRCDHGLYPVPAPATLEIMKGLPIAQSDLRSELTTPTGAGIIASLVSNFGTLPHMTVESIGYGAGTRNLPERPNVLRIIIGTVPTHQREHVQEYHEHATGYQHEHQHHDENPDEKYDEGAAVDD